MLGERRADGLAVGAGAARPRARETRARDSRACACIDDAAGRVVATRRLSRSARRDRRARRPPRRRARASCLGALRRGASARRRASASTGASVEPIATPRACAPRRPRVRRRRIDKQHAVIADLDAIDNATLASLARLVARRRARRRARERARGRPATSRRSASNASTSTAPLGALSGGTQQKIFLAARARDAPARAARSTSRRAGSTSAPRPTIHAYSARAAAAGLAWSSRRPTLEELFALAIARRRARARRASSLDLRAATATRARRCSPPRWAARPPRDRRRAALRASSPRRAGRAALALALVVAHRLRRQRRRRLLPLATRTATMLREIGVDGILACGMTVVVVAGGIDLAVGSVLALAAVSFAQAHHPARRRRRRVAIVLVAGVGARRRRRQRRARRALPHPAVHRDPRVMVFARGLAKHLAGGKKVTNARTRRRRRARVVPRPAIFDALDARVLGGNVAIVTLVFLACVARHLRRPRPPAPRPLPLRRRRQRGGGAPLRRPRRRDARRRVRALRPLRRRSPASARPRRRRTAIPRPAIGYELDAIAMVVIGGTSLAGGRGGVGLTLLGALTIGYLRKRS